MQIPAYIALGANLGDRQANIQTALDRLAAHPAIRLEAVSQLYETQAVGGPPGSPPFLNGAARIGTTLSPHQLLAVLLNIEADLGRVRHAKWEPRLLDLDILLYGDLIVSNDDLVIPHPLMHERRFVLQPLAEIAPDAIHPALQLTVRQLLERLDERETARATD